MHLVMLAVVSQGLVTAKSCLAKQGLTIPRLELVSGHMAVNLIANVPQALEGLTLATSDHCWLDNSVALHWIADKGEYRQFVQNRVSRIQSHPKVLWRHVPSTDNPADLGSRGGSVVDAELWWDGPAWLSEPAKWPDDIIPEPTLKLRQNESSGKKCLWLESRPVMILIWFYGSLNCVRP